MPPDSVSDVSIGSIVVKSTETIAVTSCCCDTEAPSAIVIVAVSDADEEDVEDAEADEEAEDPPLRHRFRKPSEPMRKQLLKVFA